MRVSKTKPRLQTIRKPQNVPGRLKNLYSVVPRKAMKRAQITEIHCFFRSEKL